MWYNNCQCKSSHQIPAYEMAQFFEMCVFFLLSSKSHQVKWVWKDFKRLRIRVQMENLKSISFSSIPSKWCSLFRKSQKWRGWSWVKKLAILNLPYFIFVSISWLTVRRITNKNTIKVFLTKMLVRKLKHFKICISFMIIKQIYCRIWMTL